MPIEDAPPGRKTHQIVRGCPVRAVRGSVRFALECRPAFDYARCPHQLALEGRGAVFTAGDMRFALISRFPLARDAQKSGSARIYVKSGREHDFYPEAAGARGGRVAPGSAPGRRGAPRSNPAVLAALAGAMRLHRAVAGARCAVRDDVQAYDVCTHGGHRRRPHLQLARGSAACVTGTTGIPGSAMRRLRLCVLRLGFTQRRRISRAGCRARDEAAARRRRLQIMYGLHGGHELPRKRSTTGRDIAARVRCASETPPMTDAARYLRRADGCGLPVQQIRFADRL